MPSKTVQCVNDSDSSTSVKIEDVKYRRTGKGWHGYPLRG